MKKNIRVLICLATAAVVASCLDEKEIVNAPESQLVPMEFSAIVDDIANDTKTSLGTDFSVIWGEDESISLFSGSSHEEFSMVSRSEDGKSATFEGLTEQTGVYHAVYPYSSEYSVDEAGTITVNLADIQPATVGGFGHGVNLSTAVSSDTDLQFRNVGALIGFKMGNDNIKRVVLTATEDNQYLAGKATLQFTEEGIPAVTVTEGSASVTLTGDFVKGSIYYFVVYPGSYTNLEISYVDADGKIAYKDNPNTLTLERNGNATFNTMTMTDFISFDGDEDLFIGGEGAEAGQKFRYITDVYYNVRDHYSDMHKSVEEGDYGYYEIYTSLKAGKPYFFYTGTKDQQEKLINGTKFKIVADEETAAATVESDGVYRIRINPANRKVGLALVSKVIIRKEWDYQTAELVYTSNGTWSVSGYHISRKLNDSPELDDRYRFVMYISDVDGSNAHEQGWSQNTYSDDNPTKEFDKSYWWMMPTDLVQWQNVWKYPAWLCDNDYPERWKADVNLILNAEADHYTHEFINESELISSAYNELFDNNQIDFGEGWN